MIAEDDLREQLRRQEARLRPLLDEPRTGADLQPLPFVGRERRVEQQSAVEIEEPRQVLRQRSARHRRERPRPLPPTITLADIVSSSCEICCDDFVVVPSRIICAV